MKSAVSACLLGENCKYSGGNNFSAKVADFVKGHEVTAVCPETLGGLPVPRQRSEIVNGVVRYEDGTPVDSEFRRGAGIALKIVEDSGAELVILQSRSPSCGAKEVYDGSFSGRLVSGQGIFAHLLEERGIRVIDVSDL
ncbi:MAG: DUF523 domain-containing protein [Clostridia bacterium]|nr:DUF523 domain-containing protein [Clostridia bacterium]